MSAYTTHPRVTDLGFGHYDVVVAQGDGPVGRVQPRPGGQFVAFVDVESPDRRLFPTADEAIQWLIGES